VYIFGSLLLTCFFFIIDRWGNRPLASEEPLQHAGK
jgi:hypothetical protein